MRSFARRVRPHRQGDDGRRGAGERARSRPALDPPGRVSPRVHVLRSTQRRTTLIAQRHAAGPARSGWCVIRSRPHERRRALCRATFREMRGFDSAPGMKVLPSRLSSVSDSHSARQVPHRACLHFFKKLSDIHTHTSY